MQLFEAPRTYFEPILSLLQLFEASSTFFEPLAIIWSFLHHIRASCNYLKLQAPISSFLQLLDLRMMLVTKKLDSISGKKNWEQNILLEGSRKSAVMNTYPLFPIDLKKELWDF